MQNYHRLFLLSQERYDRLANLAGSGGASDIKDADILDPAFVDIEMLRNSGCNSQYQDDSGLNTTTFHLPLLQLHLTLHLDELKINQ
jgi:hypothetical protein